MSNALFILNFYLIIEILTDSFNYYIWYLLIKKNIRYISTFFVNSLES